MGTNTSVSQKGLPIFRSPGKKHNTQKQVMNSDNFYKYILCRIILEFHDKKAYPTVKKLTHILRHKINYWVLYHQCSEFYKEGRFKQEEQ
jgi:hypothetical protein